MLEGLCPFQRPSSSVQLVELNKGDGALAYNSDVPHLASVESEHNMLEPEITLYALLGSPSPGRMRIRGIINGHWVIILIDTSSTHNFLDAAILSKLQLQLDLTVSFEVKVGNGETIKTKGVCVDVKVVMQGHVFSMDLNVLPLGDCELVLETQWLRSLGLIQWEFLALSMQFMHLGRPMTLFGLHPTNSTLQEGDHFFRKPIKKGIFLQIVSLGSGTSPS